MMRTTTALAALLLVASTGCFDRVMGSTVKAEGDGDASVSGAVSGAESDACVMNDAAPVLDAALGVAFPSNGLTIMEGVDPEHVTTLSGHCRIYAGRGEIECDGLAIRLNQPGVSDGVGYERMPPSHPFCAGSEVPAPNMNVFSFGTLELAPSTTLSIFGDYPGQVTALLAAGSIRIHGTIKFGEFAGGYTYEYSSESPMVGLGLSPGVAADGDTLAGGSGAGGATPGGVGGSAGCDLAPQIPAQYEPLCGGSTGGSTGLDQGDGTWECAGRGGDGGGALQLSAMESIEITDEGEGECWLSADGEPGESYSMGPGGGAGGTLVLEAPTVTVDGACRVTANGGRGAQVQHNCGGAGGEGGSRDAPPQPGTDVPPPCFGGGGGGAAGFIRVRDASCAGDYSRFSPAPDCDVLP